MSLKVVLPLLLAVVFLVHCKKEVITTDPGAKLEFSSDSITFDTVFTTLGSTTQILRVYNRNDNAIRISEIWLDKMDSQFRINVDGMSEGPYKDVEILGKDSIFIFIEVTVDPNDESSPFVILENLNFLTNGNKQEVVLEAWGQNAYYYRPNTFQQGLPPLSFLSDYDYFPVATITDLPNDKPHVIFGYLVIDSAITLNIPPGTQLHLFQSAGIWAYRGSTLRVQGAPGDEVVFQGTRLESFYDDIPGQWDRILVNDGPQNHVFSNVIIKNGTIGIQAEDFYLDGGFEQAPNAVYLYNAIIENNQAIGILSRNHNILCDNTLIYNSKSNMVALQGAGFHRFRQTTMANYWNLDRRGDELLLMTNYFNIPTGDEVQQVSGNLDVRFDNSIAYGNLEEEILVDSSEFGSIKWRFDHCVIKTELDVSNSDRYIMTVVNPERPFGFTDAVFVDPFNEDFLLNDSSAAIDVGSLMLMDTLTIDLKGDLRDNKPDAGAYEYLPE